MSNVISNLNHKPVSVYFCKDWETQIPAETLALITRDDALFKTEFYGHWKDLSDVLDSKPSQIIFHIDMLVQDDTTIFEFMSMLDTLIKFTTPGRTIPIGVSIDKETPFAVIRDLKRTSLVGIVPSAESFGISEMTQGLTMLVNQISYWPKHILDQLPGAVIKTKNAKDEIALTNRQTEIFDLVCKRGLSNKKIAQILNISESTVKVHISAILKAYKVRNRTQLALSGSEFGLRA